MKTIRTWTVVGWCLLVLILGYFYARSRVYAPDSAPGYETTWSFQLAMYAIFRLPIYVIILCCALVFETQFFKARNRKGDSKPGVELENK